MIRFVFAFVFVRFRFPDPMDSWFRCIPRTLSYRITTPLI